MSDQPYFRTDYLAPPHDTNVISPATERHDAAAASRVAVAEQMAHDRALGRPRVAQPELPPIKTPVLANDFAQRVAQLDQEIYARGVAVDSDKLLQLGKERFALLIAADRQCRSSRAVGANDLTSFAAVQRGLHAFEAASVPRRKLLRLSRRAGKSAKQCDKSDWPDLWKAASQDPEPVQKAYSFHDAFKSVVFARLYEIF